MAVIYVLGLLLSFRYFAFCTVHLYSVFFFTYPWLYEKMLTKWDSQAAEENKHLLSVRRMLEYMLSQTHHNYILDFGFRMYQKKTLALPYFKIKKYLQLLTNHSPVLNSTGMAFTHSQSSLTPGANPDKAAFCLLRTDTKEGNLLSQGSGQNL